MEKALFMKRSFKRWIALFLVFCMTFSPLQSLAAAATTEQESSSEETATPSDADDIEFQYDQQPGSAEEVAEIIAAYQDEVDSYNEAIKATDSDASELKFPTLPKWKDALEDTDWIPEGWTQKELTDEATGSVYWSLNRGITAYGSGPTDVFMGGGGADEPLDIVVTNTGGISTMRWYNESAFGEAPDPDYYQVYFNQLEGNGLSLWDGTTELMHGGSFGAINLNADNDFPENLDARNWGFTAQPLNVDINIDSSEIVGNTHTVKRSWTGLEIAEGIVIEETITYTKGATFYTRTMKIINNSTKDANNLRLFLTADPYFRGYDESYANWHLGNKEVYAYQEMTDGIMSIRGGDSEESTPTRFYAGSFYGEGEHAPNAIANLTLGKDLNGATLPDTKDDDSFFALQWGDMENPMSIPAGGSREIQTIDSFSDPGALQITPPAEKKAPPTATVPFVFMLRNMCIDEADLMDITLTARTENGWTTLVRPSSTQLVGGAGRGVTVEVMVPENATEDEIVYLDASYEVRYQGALLSGTVTSQTKILLTNDPTFEYISQVKIMKYDNVTLDAKVSFRNVPELAARNTTIVIRKENGEFTNSAKGPVSIRSGGTIEGIDVANLEPGRYYLYVTAEGIQYPHNSTYFTVGEEIYAITDMELNPTDARIFVGDELEISATCLPIETNETGVNWESSDPTIATVDSFGLVTALKPGEVEIKASSTVDIEIVRTSRIRIESLVNFETYEGPLVPHQEIPAGGKAQQPDIRRPGFRLVGWYQDPNFTNEWDFDDEVTTNMVLHALWEESSFILEYHINGAVEGVVPGPSVHSSGDSIISAPDNGLIKEGHTFDGWNTRPDGTGTDYLADAVFEMPDDNLDLFVKWQRHEPRYTVTYHVGNADGGSVPEDITEYEIYTEVILMGNTGDLFKAGRSFVGWVTEEGDIIYEPSGQFRITEDTDLYPKWDNDDTIYYVEFRNNDATGGTEPPVIYEKIDTWITTVDQGSLYKAGHRFTDWNTKEDGSGKSYAVGERFRLVDNLIVYAQWERVNTEFVVTYHANGATGGMLPTNAVSYPVDRDVTVAHNTGHLYRAANDFDGWNTEADGSGQDYVMGSTFRITESVTLYAKWKSNDTTFMVSYDGNGADGGSVPAGPTPYAINSNVEVLGNSDLFKNGMIFDGWNTAADGSGSSYAAGDEFRLQERTVLYAQWEEGTEEFTLTYEANGADHGQVPEAVTERINTLVTIEGNIGDLYKAGYRFAGWMDENHNVYQAGETLLLTRYITLSAKWDLDSRRFTVSYDKNGAVNGELPSEDTAYPIDSTITVLGNTGGLYMAGRTFSGWTMRADGTGTVLRAGDTFRLTENTVLYAKWTYNEIGYTVTYNGNTNTGGTAPQAQNLAIDTQVTVAGQEGLYKAGHQFTGWATEANGGGVSYQPGAEFRLVDDVTLYAQWELVTGEGSEFVVTYHANEATGGMLPTPAVNYPVDTDVLVAHNTGYLYKVANDFDGWNTAADGSGQDYVMGSTFRITESVTLYAKWKSNDTTFVVSYDGNGANGGTVPAGPTPYAINSNVTVLGNTDLFKTGMVFDGWNTATDGSGSSYAAGDEFRLQEATVLYAQWTEGTERFTLKYEANGADHGQAPEAVTELINTLVTIEGNTGDLYKEGNRFNGWRDEAGTVYSAGQVILLTGNMTLSAVWVGDETRFTVSYDKNGAVNGELPSQAITYPIDSTITVLGNDGNLFMAGKTFEGWTMSSDGSGTVLTAGDTFRLTEDTVLYANWAESEIRFIVSYDGNTNTGGTAPQAQAFEIDTLVTVVGQEDLYKAAHQFTGWATEANGGGVSYQPGATFRLVEDVTLYAQWELVTGEGSEFVVTYHANEATGGMLPTPAVNYPVDTNVLVAHNTGNLYKAANDFDGWNTEADGSGQDYVMGSTFRITESVTLYAKWKSNNTTFVVSYDGNGADGGSVPAGPTPYAINSNVTVLGNTDLFKNGMVFDGWNVAADGTHGDNLHAGDIFRIQETTVLYAQWKEGTEEFTLTYDANGADHGQAPGSVTERINTLITIEGNTGDLYKSGQRFDGWMDENQKVYRAGESLLLTRDITLFAMWVYDQNVFTVSYDKNGAVNGELPIGSLPYPIDSTITVLGNTGNLYMAGKTFEGWTMSADGTGTVLNAGDTFRLTGDTVLYAKWADSEIRYTVTYDGNTNTGGTAPQAQDFEIDTLVTVAGQEDLYKAAHQFTGWTTEANGGGESYQPGDEFRLVEDVTLYAQWRLVTGEEFEFVVTYHANEATGGMIPTPAVNYPVDTDVLVAHNTGHLYKAANDFDGWNTEADGSGQDYVMGSTFRITESVTLYAKWKSNDTTFVVSYDGNGADGGSVPAGPTPYAINSHVTVLGNTDLFKTGMIFDGWNTAADGSGSNYIAGDEFRLQETTVLYAQWTEGTERFTLKYEANGADHGQVPEAVTELINTLVTIEGNSGDLYKAGNRFGGWEDETGVAYTAGQEILLTGDITLSAVWVQDGTTFTVSYDKNGAVNGELPIGSLPYPIDNTITVLGNTGNLYIAGMTFEGWTMSSDGSGTVLNAGDTFRLTGDTVLYAKWTDSEIRYTVTYDGNTNTGGTAPQAQNLEIDTLVTVANQGDLYKAAHQFTGWATEANGGGVSYQPGATFRLVEDVTLYAQWELVTGEGSEFVVTYHANEATGGMLPTPAVNYPVDTNVLVAHNTGNLYKAANDFDGWNTEADGSGQDYVMGSTFRITESVTLYAKWKSNNTTFVVSYDGNGADGGSVPAGPTPYAINSNVTVLGNTDLFKTGMVFDGWNTAEDGSGNSYAAGDEFRLQETTVLYAQWTEGTERFILTYEANGADHGQVPETVTELINTLVTIEGNSGDLYKAGNRFGGWEDETGVAYTAGQEILLTGDITLSAVWVQDGTTFTVSYDKNGAVNGELPEEITTHPIDSTITVLGNTGGLYMAGRTFVGWTISTDGSGTVLNAGDTFRLTGDTVLYAKWANNEIGYTVTYDGNTNTGGVAPQAQNLAIDTQVTVVGQEGLYKAGHQFTGWATEANGGGVSYQPGATFRLVEDVTLYAQWELVTGEGSEFVVIYHANEATGGMLPTNAVSYPVDTDVLVADNTGNLYKAANDFDGWNTEADGSGQDYVIGSTFRITESVTLYAKWKSNDTTFVVSYDGNGAVNGELPSQAITYPIDSTITVLGNTGNLYMAGNTFEGWTMSSDGSGIVLNAGDTFRLTGDTVLYAKWAESEIRYTVTYDRNQASSGEVPIAEDYLIDSDITIQGNTGGLHRAGFDFAGWNTNENGLGEAYQGGEVVRLSGSLTLYAQWEVNENQYTLTYDGNGNGAVIGGIIPVGGTHPVNTELIVQGDEEDIFQKAKDFVGWNTKSNGSGSWYYKGNPLILSENMTLYAQWRTNPITYTVAYYENGADAGSIIPAGGTYEVNDRIKVEGNGETVFRAGYDFVGWTLNAAGTGAVYKENDMYRVRANAKFYAKWEVNEIDYTFKYDGNGFTGGSVPVTNETYPANTNMEVAGNKNTIYKAGFTFEGWTTNIEGTGRVYVEGDTILLNENVTLYAKWTPVETKHTVVYNGNGATGGTVPVDEAYSIDTDVQVLGNTGSLFKAGYTFDGWTSEDGTTAYLVGSTFRLEGDTELFANWVRSETRYTFAYDKNGATGGLIPENGGRFEVDTVVVVEVHDDELYKAGYTFAGWSLNAAGTGVTYQAGDEIRLTSDITLYAKWTSSTLRYAVSYNGNGATGGTVPLGNSYPIDTDVQVLGNTGNLFKAGYTFKGWASEDGSITYEVGSRFRLEGDTELFAKWERSEVQFTFSYNKNGATGGSIPGNGGRFDIDTVVVVEVHDNELYRAGYIFAGWALNAAGTGTTYQTGDEIRLTSDITLYAKWTSSPLRYAVNYNGNGADGGTIPSGSIHNINSDVTVAGNPNGLYKAGKVFEGWTISSDGSGTVYSEGDSYRVQRDTTFFAKWADSTEPRPILTYNKNGGQGIVPEPQAHDINSQVTVSGNPDDELYKKGQDLKGWTKNANGSGILYKEGDKILLTENTTLYAQWKAHPTKYTLTYNGNGSTGGSVPIAAGGPFELNEMVETVGNTGNLYRTGYTFKGWALNAAGTGDSYPDAGSLRIRRNTIVYAKWVADEALYSVTYKAEDKDGGTVPTENAALISTKVTVKGNTEDLFKLGHKFDGWKIEGDASAKVYRAGDFFILTGDTVLHATWLIDNSQYKVTYNANGALGTVPTQANVPASTEITIQTQGDLYKAGYTFNGWTTNANGTGTKYEAGATLRLTANVILYAQWKISTDRFTVTYNGNGALGGSAPMAVVFPVDTMVTVAGNTGALYKAGVDFAGWNTEVDGTGVDYPVTSTFRLTGNITLYAMWSDNPNTFRVTYNANISTTAGNGGTVPTEATYLVNEDVTIMSNTGNLYQVGFALEGWTENANGSGTVYKEGTTFRITKNTTLYAKWKLSNVSVILTYDANVPAGGVKEGNAPGPQTVLINGKTTVAGAGNLKIGGYKFLGWSANKNALIADPSYAPGTLLQMSEKITLYAVWEKFSITIIVTLTGRNVAGNMVNLGTMYFTAEEGDTHFAHTQDNKVPMPAGWRYNVGNNTPRPMMEKIGDTLTQTSGAVEGKTYYVTILYRPAL